MNKLKGLFAIAAVAILASGCAQVPAEKWKACAIAGAVAGAAAGAAEDDHHDTRDAIAGAMGGALIGGTICALMAEEDKPMVVPKDSDNDGVIDSLDECPNTPAGAAVDAKGCPLDSDNDGVANYKDQCPDSAPGAVVNKLGCVNALVLKGVNFANDSAELTEASKAILAPIAVAHHTHHADVDVVIGGHTDSIGSSAYNQALSQRRADAVRAYMISQGCADNKFTAVGHGEAKAIADNATAAGRSQNRRVELTVK